jgi:hypothetical protein
MLILTACSNDNESTSFENNFPPHDMSEYGITGDHRFYYVTMGEALQLLDEESFNGILYFGFPGCPWCQVAVPLIYQASQETETDVFYVSRRHEIRETENWEEWDIEMAERLNEQIEMRWLYDDSEPYRPNIFVPQIIHLRNGIIIDDHRSTFEGHDLVLDEDSGEEDDYYLPDLTPAQRDTLLEIYIRIFSAVHSPDTCTLDDTDDDSCS